MGLIAAIRVALRALVVNKGRAGLTSLGIVIGISAVIAMVAVGRGAREKLNEKLANYGPNMLVIMSGKVTKAGIRIDQGKLGTLTRDDAEAIRRECADVVTNVGELNQDIAVVRGTSGRSWTTVIVGAYHELFAVRDWHVRLGKPYGDAEDKARERVCLIGQRVADEVFPDHPDPTGQTLRIRNQPFRVIGVLAEKGRSITGVDQDDTVFIPMSTMLKTILGGQDQVLMILASAKSTQAIDAAKTQIQKLLRQRHRIKTGETADFDVNSVRDMGEIAVIVMDTLGYVVAAIASISLVVGGIGIMNIMLVSVTERTREIGLRMAIGATSRDILLQFLIESIVLALIGGTIGILLGFVVSALPAVIFHWPIMISSSTVLMAAGVATAVGVFFGYYPAYRASLLDPIEALRHE